MNKLIASISGLVLGLFAVTTLTGCAHTSITPASSFSENNRETIQPTEEVITDFNLQIIPKGGTLPVLPPTKKDADPTPNLDKPKPAPTSPQEWYLVSTEDEPVVISNPSGTPTTLKIGEQSVTIGSGETVLLSWKETKKKFGGKDTHNISGKGTGIGVETTDPSSIKGIGFGAPTSEIDGASGSGGSSKFVAQAVSAITSGYNWLLILGGILMAGGVAVIIWLPTQKSIGLAAATAGLTMIVTSVVASQYPWVFLILGVVVLGALGFWLYTTYKNNLTTKTLTTVVKGVENAPEAEATTIKSSIKEIAEKAGIYDAVKKTVSKVKAKTQPKV